MPSPFEVPFDEIENNADTYIDEVFSTLRSEFLVLPKGGGFVGYDDFDAGYQALKAATSNFRTVSELRILEAVRATPIALVVLRTILGLTPPEWAYLATAETGVETPQGAARTLDGRIRRAPRQPMRAMTRVTEERVVALIRTACIILTGRPPFSPEGVVHRLDQVDKAGGLRGLQSVVDDGVPYQALLYERLLGRPFASHRDAVSENVGDVVEDAAAAAMEEVGIDFYKTPRAERIPGWDQVPDFIVPSRDNAQVVIEAKLTEDDGTARDKVTRVQHLGFLSMEGVEPGQAPRFEVIACIAGRGFKVRREDMRRLLLSTRGKVFTLETIDKMVPHTRLREFAAH